ncbi:MAG: hypothetical protein HQL99_17110, partial [Magnetococcales bacterium]|nr:hypothetical protein [Magnetococcales bacterium]
DDPAAYHAESILYLPAESRFDYLLHRPEAEDIGAKVNAALREDLELHALLVRYRRNHKLCRYGKKQSTLIIL